MIKEVTRTHHGIYGYIENDNKVLLIIKRRGPYTGMYDLPGGSMENNETEEETLAREITEETGCRLKSWTNRQSRTIIFDEFTEDDGRQGCLVHSGILFDCEVLGIPDASISELDSGGAVWVEKDKLTSQNSTPFVLLCIRKY